MCPVCVAGTDNLQEPQGAAWAPSHTCVHVRPSTPQTSSAGGGYAWKVTGKIPSDRHKAANADPCPLELHWPGITPRSEPKATDVLAVWPLTAWPVARPIRARARQETPSAPPAVARRSHCKERLVSVYGRAFPFSHSHSTWLRGCC